MAKWTPEEHLTFDIAFALKKVSVTAAALDPIRATCEQGKLVGYVVQGADGNPSWTSLLILYPESVPSFNRTSAAADALAASGNRAWK